MQPGGFLSKMDTKNNADGDSAQVSVRCLDVWEGPTPDSYTLMSSSHTALLLYLPFLLRLLCLSFSDHPFLFSQVNFLHGGRQQVGHCTVVFIIDGIEELKRELALFTSLARGRYTSG